jgi:phage tail-like protein
MAETARRADPVRAFRFAVLVPGLPTAGFSECTGLSVQTEVREYPEGGLNTHLQVFPGRASQSRLVLKRGIVDRAFHDWFWDIVQGTIVRRSGSIVVLDEGGAMPAAEWRFRDAFPAKWNGPDLNAAQSSVAVETIELVHLGLERRI